MVLQFDEYKIDTENFTLSRFGQTLEVEPTVLKVIAYLAENRDKIVTREQIFSKVWPDRCVSDSALSNHIKNARKILGDDGNRQLMIKTIHGRGYQFIREVMELTQHVISVLPLTNSKPSFDTDYYGAAVSHIITASLSLIPAITICPVNIVERFSQLANEKAGRVKSSRVDYVLTGNYIEENNVIRLNLELVDLKNNSICWLDSIELESCGIFVLQDLVANMVTKGVIKNLNIKFVSNSSIVKAEPESFQHRRKSRVNKKSYLQLL